jgi:uncharacterized protein YecE (DUF72 family)
MLSWYARDFSTVELNNSFYRLPRELDFKRWAETVPGNFHFSVKASRYLTHRKRLLDAEEATNKFLSHAESLGKKLGPVLFQLPPNWRGRPDRLEEYLAILPASHRYVFEFRDIRWYTPEVYSVLRRYRAALCLHDWRMLEWPVEFTTDFTYVRFHGPSGSYSGGYTAKTLRQWAENILGWRQHLAEIFLYFNNDLQGHAIKNAKSLRDLLKDSPNTKAA